MVMGDTAASFSDTAGRLVEWGMRSSEFASKQIDTRLLEQSGNADSTVRERLKETQDRTISEGDQDDTNINILLVSLGLSSV